MNHTLTGVCALAALALPSLAHAHTVYADDHAPIGVMADHAHKKGEFMISLRAMHMEMSGNQIGTDGVSPDQITDILITHGPPHGFGDRIDPHTHVGCEDLLQAITRVRPGLHLFGHIHQDHGAWPHHNTLLANVTTDEGELPATVFEWRDGRATLVFDAC